MRRVRPSYDWSSPAAPHVLEGRRILRRILPPDATPARRIAVAVLAAFAGVCAYGIVSQAAQGSAIDARVRALTQQNAQLREQISERRQQIGEANNVAWLEEQARRLGFVFPGESLFIITPPGAQSAQGGGVNAPLPTFAPAPSAPPPVPSGSPSPSPRPNASPTPLVFVMPSASPTPTGH